MKIRRLQEFMNSQSDSFYNQAASLKMILWPELGSNVERVNIVPDNLLFNISFESLCDLDNNEPIFSILNNYTVSYSFYGKEELPCHVDIKKSGFTSIEPHFINSNKFPSLNSSIHKVDDLNIFRGDRSEDLISSFALERPVVLTTHGVYNSTYSSIWFSDLDSLLISDLQEYRSRNPLIIFNACETGQGKLQEIEGLMNYAYTLKLIGANSVSVNLWKANAFATSKINKNFISNLQRYTVSDALTQAKRTFLLSEDVSRDLRHPYYWSSMILYK